jgi:hypothetical protein
MTVIQLKHKVRYKYLTADLSVKHNAIKNSNIKLMLLDEDGISWEFWPEELCARYAHHEDEYSDTYSLSFIEREGFYEDLHALDKAYYDYELRLILEKEIFGD